MCKHNPFKRLSHLAKPMPDPIPARPENVSRAILETPPEKTGKWNCLQEGDDGGG